MKGRLVAGLVILLFLIVGCALPKSSYFGVSTKAIGVPKEFEQTENAVARAEKAPNARYCPAKLQKAKELGKKGVQAYWACKDKEAMAMLAEARKLAAEVEKFQVPTLQGVNFKLNSAELSGVAVAILEEQAKKLNKWFKECNPRVKIEVAGYTCSLGSDAYNKKLSERRAKAARDLLVIKGVPADRLITVGYGESNPIASNKTEAGRSKNRRVELHIIE